MKKSLYAILVILLSTIGASALAEKLDKNVQRVVVESSNDSGNQNGNGSNGGGVINAIVRGK